MPKSKKKNDPNVSTEERFAEDVGRAVIAFQHVETASSALFCELLKSSNPMGARAVFYRLNNFATRIDLMDLSARWLFKIYGDDGALLKRWEAIKGTLWA